ncbi:TF28 protein, partial [Eolophus roseicapillus]|nr:TF28 protein [Eolophus roseicapilla]
LHQGSHWGTQVMCDLVLQKYGGIGIYTIAKQICDKCEICQRINKKVIRKQPEGGRNPGLRLFQSIQVDFTELPKVGCVKYLLVLVDHLTGWVEAFPLTTVSWAAVVKIILEQIIPRYGIVENIDSDKGGHFTSQILQGLMNSLEISWDFHTPWHPPSLGKVERMTQTLKKQLSELVLETELPWTECLPIALLSIRTAPPKDVGISPYEMLFGLPYLGRGSEIPQFETKDMFLKNYILWLSSSLSSLRCQGVLAQTPPLEFTVHKFQPGDWVLIKSWKEV